MSIDIKKPKVVIMCGTPCSGKSTLALTMYKDYIRINQDALKSRRKCIDMMEMHLAAGADVVVDRCNPDKAQRKIWIDIAKKYDIMDIECVYVKTSFEECKKRILLRKGHETIKDDFDEERKIGIVKKFFNWFKEPELSEGFTKITVIGEENNNGE